MKKEHIKKILNFLFKLSITTLAIYLVLRKIDFDELWVNLKKSNLLYLTAGFIIFLLSKLIEAFRINVFYRNIGIYMSEVINAKLYLLGMFYNLFLPGGVGGDGYKVFWLKKNYGTTFKPLISASVINRANGMMALLFLLIITGAFISFPYPYQHYLPLLIPVGFILYYFLLKLFFKLFLPAIWKTTGQSLLIQFTQVLSIHFILLAFQVNDHFIDYWFIYLLSGIAFAIPVTLGGVGAREVVFIYGAEYLPIDLNIAIAMSLIIYVYRAIASFGGVYFLAYPSKITGETKEQME